MQTITSRFLRSAFVINAAFLLPWLPDFAQASPWEKLGRNARYEVALDMASVRLTTSGRLGVWLRFTPLGESQRRQAVTEFKKKAYRLHMEYYEINCDEDRAVLGLRDIIGTKGKRLLRFMGEGDPEAVEPGSILELAVQRICPVVEENSAQDMQGAEGTDIATVGKDTPEIGIPPEARQHITDLLKRTGADPADPAAWAELGNAYFDSDMPREAIEAYSRSLALKPDNTDVLNDQGAMYRQAGDITQALKNFEKALGIDQHNLESLYNIGYIYAFDLNRIGRALETWRRYLELDRSSETARQVQSFIELYDH